MRSVHLLRWVLMAALAATLLTAAMACGSAEEAQEPGVTAEDMAAIVQEAMQVQPPGVTAEDMAAIVQEAMQAQQPGVTAEDMASAIQQAMQAQQPGVTTEDVGSEIAKALRAQPGGVTSQEMASAISNALAEQPGGVTSEEMASEIAKALAAQPGGVTEEQMAMAVESALKAQPGISPEDVQMAVESAVESAVQMAVAAAIPTAAPAMEDSMVMMAPSGTLNIGFKELEAYSVSPRLTQTTITQYAGTVSHETLLRITIDKTVAGKLAEEWSVDSTGIVWTFKLNEGVQFHGGWGEATVDDYIFSLNDLVADDGINALAPTTRRIFFAEGGGITKIDDYRFEVDTVTPQFQMLSFGTAVSALNYTVSKKQFEHEGEDVAKFSAAGTGAWAFAGEITGQNWRFDAVEDHYRKTPEFAKLVMWTIPEEATRVSNFQVGKLDSFQMALDSKAAVDRTEDIRYMAVPNGATEHLGFFGNWYVGIGTDAQEPGYDPELPWVSASADVNSPEWERARKVREALSIAIDRDLIVETILGGEGQAQSLWFWENQIHNLDPDLRTIEFNPERAKQLLEQAGYPDGFSITVATSIRSVPGESETCEAIAEMWEDIGIDTQIQSIPYATLGNQLAAREYNGANCHGTGGRLDPLELIPVVFESTAGFTGGSNHPILDDLIAEARLQISDEGHFRVLNQFARFVYENVMETGLYSVNVLWPLGPRVESWVDHLEFGDVRSFGAYEFAKHRSR